MKSKICSAIICHYFRYSVRIIFIGRVTFIENDFPNEICSWLYVFYTQRSNRTTGDNKVSSLVISCRRSETFIELHEIMKDELRPARVRKLERNVNFNYEFRSDEWHGIKDSKRNSAIVSSKLTYIALLNYIALLYPFNFTRPDTYMSCICAYFV